MTALPRDLALAATWAEHGLPDDASTLVHVPRVLAVLLADRAEAWALIGEMVDAVGSHTADRYVCADLGVRARALTGVPA